MKKKSKGTKKCAVNRKMKLKDYKDCIKASQIVLRFWKKKIMILRSQNKNINNF